jgi:hypothetical protein
MKKKSLNLVRNFADFAEMLWRITESTRPPPPRMLSGHAAARFSLFSYTLCKA